MYCPNCGTQPQLADQKFCKTCGTNLSMVSQVLSAPGPGPGVPAPYMPAPPPSAMMIPNQGALAPTTSPTFPQATVHQPISLTEIPSLPYMEQERARQKLMKIAWALTLGGPFLIPTLAILGEFMFNTGELAVLGIPVFLFGIFLLLYTKIALRKPDLPQVIVIQQGNSTQEMTPSPVSAVPSGMNHQLPAGASTPLYTPGMFTEHTTQHLQVPYSQPGRNTK